MRLLQETGGIRSANVARAVAAVPREAFLDPGTPVEVAYANQPVLLKSDALGRAISTISQPSMIVAMLEQMQVSEGDRVLEIGTASGYNAALIAELTGPTGLVVTIELEADLAADADWALKALGVDNVDVITGDGSVGWPPAAPYDEIVVTAAAEQIEPAWKEQLAEGGRLVVPLARSSLCLGYQKRNGELVEESRVPAAFVPIRHTPGVSE